jgi:hypothetical protein
MNVDTRIDKCEWSPYLPISSIPHKEDWRTQSIGSPAGFIIVALNGLWVCRNCLVIVDSNVRSSSARLYISFHSHSRTGEDVQSNEMAFWGVDRIAISLFVLPSASHPTSIESRHTPIKILSISICLSSVSITCNLVYEITHLTITRLSFANKSLTPCPLSNTPLESGVT